MSCRIRLILPRGKVAANRVRALVHGVGGRVLLTEGRMHTMAVRVAEVFVSLNKGSARQQLLAALLQSAGFTVLNVDVVVRTPRRGRS